MTKFTAGRFVAEVFPGYQNGRATVLVELHRNGSGEQMGKLNVDFDDLPDLKHVLDRAIAAHREARHAANEDDAATPQVAELGWGDRVVDTRKHRHRGRQGTYRSQCHPSLGDRHNILWDGRKTAERVWGGDFGAASPRPEA